MSLSSDPAQPAEPSPQAEVKKLAPQAAAQAARHSGQRSHDWLSPMLMGGGLVVALVAAGWFSMRLFAPPVQKKAEVQQARMPQVTSKGAVATSDPAAGLPVKTAPPVSSSSPVTLQMIAKAEAARQAKPAGPLYEKQRNPVVLSFATVKLDAPEVKEAQAVLVEFLKTSVWKERLHLVFHPETTEARMQEYYEKRNQPDPEQGELKAAVSITAGDSHVLNLQFACSMRPETGLRANFHQTRGGKLLLDWESWSAWCETDWAAFKQQRSPQEVVMRAIASESDYYNYEFSDKWNWLAVKLRSADGLHTVTGYIQRNSTLGVALANLIGVPIPHNLPSDAPIPAIKPPGSKSLVTLRLRFPLNAQSDSCVMITDMLADRWLLFPGEEK